MFFGAKIRLMIIYSTDKTLVDTLVISDFFQGWPNPPSLEVLVASIKNASYAVLAIDDSCNQLAGYITAVSDRVLSAYIPFLEVVPSYQNQGIGHELVNKMLKQLEHLYMIDLVCDTELAGFYAEAGLVSWHAMIKRHYANQRGPSGGVS